ncbi:MAG: DUF1697 domain-containing protein [Spirochaetes bacterium]|nr:MAG: DUF1697 domain-containing protein [Spirochaetota bacterium]
MKALTTLIAFLRGINVSGQKPVRMTDLVALFESLGYARVRTYIQSGNVVFEAAAGGVDALESDIGEAIRKKYGYEVTVIIRTADELRDIVAGNPLLKILGIAPDRFYVTLFDRIPDARKVAGLAMGEDDAERYEVKGREAYLYCPRGYGRSRLNNQAFEKKLGLAATTRSWKTMLALLEMTQP